jgi:Methyltransferase domain
MNQQENTLKSVFPPKLSNFLIEAYYKSVPHQMRSFLRGKRRDLVFQQAMKQFLMDPGACAHPGNPVLIDLIYGWGNEAWSAREEYLAGCIRHSLTSSGPILECGSGLSTILLGSVAKRQGKIHWVLEHKTAWAKKVQRYLDIYQLDSVVYAKPLKDYRGFCWYDVPLESMPGSFSLVVCDGPPRRTKGGRYGLVPVMKERLISGCIILLDDAARHEELEIAKRWETELDAPFNIQGTVKPYIKMVVA